LWGSGTPKREFLHVDDLASAVVFAVENKMKEFLYNVGSGEEISIKELAELVQRTVGHKGEIIWDKKKPDGTPRKLLNGNNLRRQGWISKIGLKIGVNSVYNWFTKNYSNIKSVKF